MKRSGKIWAWIIIIIGVLYFFLPLLATFLFSLRAKLGVLSFQAYSNVFTDPKFIRGFSGSLLWATLTISLGILLFVPTAFWVRLKVPKARAPIEFITLIPFVVPPIVYTFGLIRTYSHRPLLWVDSPFLLVAAYTIISMPYLYRAIDIGLRSIDVRTLTEAAQSLGAGWGTVLFRIIIPNIKVAILNGAFLSFAIVIGEYILARYLVKPAFAPYMLDLGQNRAYEPAAAAVISFALTWACMGIISLIGRGRGQAPVGGGH
jgi:putative spermidine/putrescine transport system permease protein